MLELNHIRLAGVHSMLSVGIRRTVTILHAKRVDQRQTQGKRSCFLPKTEKKPSNNEIIADSDQERG